MTRYCLFTRVAKAASTSFVHDVDKWHNLIERGWFIEQVHRILIFEKIKISSKKFNFLKFWSFFYYFFYWQHCILKTLFASMHTIEANAFNPVTAVNASISNHKKLRELILLPDENSSIHYIARVKCLDFIIFLFILFMFILLTILAPINEQVSY